MKLEACQSVGALSSNQGTIAFVALGLGLTVFEKFPIDWQCPLQNKNGLVLSKIKLQACQSASALPSKSGYRGLCCP